MKKEQLAELMYQALETEQGGIKVYETALRCAVNEELREEWAKYLEETRTHERIVLGVFKALDLDPDIDTPGRLVVRHTGQSLVTAMEMALDADVPDAAQLVAAECVVSAETKDHLNWELHRPCGQGAQGGSGQGAQGRARAGRGAGRRAPLSHDRLVPGAVDRVARPAGRHPAARGREGSEDGHRRRPRQAGAQGAAVGHEVQG